MADNSHETDKDYSYSSKLYFVIIFLLLHKENKPFSSESLFSDHPLLNELIQNDFFFFFFKPQTWKKTLFENLWWTLRRGTFGLKGKSVSLLEKCCSVTFRSCKTVTIQHILPVDGSSVSQKVRDGSGNQGCGNFCGGFIA